MTSSPSRDINFDALISIGDVLVRLRDEFPDISISKIRFLETNGLVTPARTPSGYRKFSLVDTERLRYILRMQRDYFLPLRVIREHIEAMDRGLEPPSVTSVAPTPPKNLMSTSAIDAAADVRPVSLTRQEICRHADITDEFLSDLESFGVVKSDRRGFYNARALEICGQAKSLSEFGLQPRHLKTVVTSATREVDLFTPILTSAQTGKKAASKAQVDELRLQLANQILALHGQLLRDILEQQN